MYAVGYRPRLSFVVLALVTLIALGALAVMSARSRSCGAWRSARVTKRVECVYTRAQYVHLAEAWYRAKSFAAAEATMREAAACVPPKVGEELHVVASFYRALSEAWANAKAAAYRDKDVHYRTALKYDAMLGGAHADELIREQERILWAVGPQ